MSRRHGNGAWSEKLRAWFGARLSDESDGLYSSGGDFDADTAQLAGRTIVSIDFDGWAAMTVARCTCELVAVTAAHIPSYSPTNVLVVDVCGGDYDKAAVTRGRWRVPGWVFGPECGALCPTCASRDTSVDPDACIVVDAPIFGSYPEPPDGVPE